MIFVTVGTHEQQFNRLVKEVDRLKEYEELEEEVFIQTGYSDYLPKYCDFKRFVTYEDMERYMSQASVVITHGGPASFMQVISLGKKPIVVPRQLQYKEHVNNHQLDFAKKVIHNGYGIELIEDIHNLNKSIKNIYSNDYISNTNKDNKFVDKFSEIVNELMGG